MANTYTDCINYLAAPTGLVLAGYVGNIGRIASCTQGATSITLISPITAVGLVQYDMLYLFDGPSSEELKVGAGGAGAGATSIPLQSPTQYAHVAGAVYCTDGIEGSLGKQLFTASQWVEDICHQSLWGETYVNEILTMPTMRAALDNQGNLHFRPRHFPITELTSVSVKTNSFNVANYDPTQAIIDSDQQTVDLPSIALIGTQQSQGQRYPWGCTPVQRSTNAWLTLTYLASFNLGGLPATIERACTLLTSECFAQLENPVGADSIQQGKANVNFVVRGDTSGESLLVKQAHSLLGPYITQSF